MEKLLKFLSFESLRGSRTKITIVLDAILYVIATIAPEFLDLATWHKIQPVMLSIATIFGIEHFETTSKKRR